MLAADEQNVCYVRITKIMLAHFIFPDIHIEKNISTAA